MAEIAGIEAHTKTGDGSEGFDVKEERHLEYWVGLPVDVHLVTLPGLKERRFG